MSRRTGRAAAALTALALAGGTVAGCGSSTPAKDSEAAEASTAASPSSSGSPSPSESPTTAPDRPGRVALSDDEGLGSPGYWGVKLKGGWQPVTLDQGGRNQIKDPRTGCMFTSQQSRDQDSPGSDATLSRALVATQAKALAQQAGTTASPVSTLVVPRGALTTSGGVEMATARVDYTRKDTGAKVTSQIAGRRFTGTDTVLLAVLNCPTTVIASRAAAVKAFTERASITTQ